MIGALIAQHAGERDPYFPKVSLLLHFDGADASTTFKDHSPNNYSPTVNGNAQVDTAQSKFGGASMLLDGTGDYLSYADATPLQMESGDFTIEFWRRHNSFPAGSNLFEKGYNTAAGILLQTNGATGNLIYYMGSGLFTESGTINTATWYFMQLIRAGSTVTLYRDGSNVGSGTDSNNKNSASAVSIGHGAASNDHDGWIDDLRITKGVARAAGVPSKAFLNE